MIKNKYIATINILFIVLCIAALLELYGTNMDLKTQISETQKSYQELRAQKLHDNFVESRIRALSLIEETFKWMKDIEGTERIILENYNGDKLNIKEDTSLNKIILRGLYLDNNIITPDNIISSQLHNDHRFFYTLRYYLKDNINEIIIFDNGTIKYKDLYYESPVLLSTAKSLMPIADKMNCGENDALAAMLNSSLATCSNYRLSDMDKSDYEQGLINLWDNAVRLRASAHFINENMVKVCGQIEESPDMLVTKSSGYSEGKQVDMYIFTVNGGEVNHVKLVYDSVEEIYQLKSELSKDEKYLYFNNIWTAD